MPCLRHWASNRLQATNAQQKGGGHLGKLIGGCDLAGPLVATAPSRVLADGETPSFERIARDSEQFIPHRFRDGLYRVADPALGPKKRHSKNQVVVSVHGIGPNLERGFLLRMRGERSGQVNLIAAAEI